MSSKLVVFGGNGFLGKRICQQAVLAGLQVTGLSRSGKPPTPVTGSDKQWISEVRWKSADIFNPDSYAKQLEDATDVVHSLGILLENENYKRNIKGTSILDFLSIPIKTANPLLYPKDSKIGEPNPDFTYDRMNTQSAVLLANTFKEVLNKRDSQSDSKPSLAYISADQGFAMIPKGYINSKRATELYLMKMDEDIENPFRSIIIRPGFMFDELSTTQIGDVRTILHDVVEVLNIANKVILRNQFKAVNETIRPTISTQQTGRCLVDKIKDKKFKGIVTLDEMLTK